MKEVGRERGVANVTVRSGVEKERTKIRERQRRSITSNIFHGLREHGGYRLSPRADINEVLRHLAQEAGWIVEPDGTTYRSSTTVSNGATACTLCGEGRKSATPTPNTSYLGCGGECSTTTSPRHVTNSGMNNLLSAGTPSILSSSIIPTNNDRLLAIYMSGAAPGNACVSNSVCSAAYGKEQQLYLLHEASVSDPNTPAGSPSRCT
ncbi:hypothetical protein BUALT_Bualt03G0018900 [Buddleja alternifolia]|uniref:Protein BZR1 homolog n=1 Tax=Buddleja alternifolia TaxID=168488 RepID=A0AAV6XQG4_9LAMI|nr:hypothetical protein BUALT_Bualt03G0018900 [Buddleja alternifolia]